MEQMKRLFLILAILLYSATTQAATPFGFLLSQVRTSSGGALVGGKAFFYSAGTSTLKTIWLDIYQTTPAANPYTLDANATAQVYGAGLYRVVIKDASGVARYDRDNMLGSGDDGSINAIDATSGNQTFSLPASGAVSVVKTDATANTVTILPAVGGQTIDGFASIVLAVQGEFARLILSGSVWYVQ